MRNRPDRSRYAEDVQQGHIHHMRERSEEDKSAAAIFGLKARAGLTGKEVKGEDIDTGDSTPHRCISELLRRD